MSVNKTAVQALQEYREARSVLAPLFTGVELLGLLRGLATTGIFELTCTPQSVNQIADFLNLDEERAAELCDTLFAHSVFIKEHGAFHLAEKWRILTSPDAPFAFQNVLDGVFARSKALRLAVENDTNFWSLLADERAALAKFGSLDPFSPYSPQIFADMLASHLPELHTILLKSGRYLELGCGLAGGLLSIVQAYPNISAVGVELAADLIEVATQRALALGVSERVQFWQGDAQSFMAQNEFDFLWWSQFFFAPPIRPGVIQVALQALKPNGFLIAPVQGNAALAYERLESEIGQMFMRNRVLFGAWGIPSIPNEQLEQELKIGGFINVRIFSSTMTLNPVIVGQKPSTTL